MKLSDHFNSSEFTCKCGCGLFIHNEELIEVLERLRNYFNKPVNINSGCRCEYWNAHEGGTKNSRHLPPCEAVDIIIEEVPPSKVADTLESWFPDSCGIGRYYTFTHFDVRDKKARW